MLFRLMRRLRLWWDLQEHSTRFLLWSILMPQLTDEQIDAIGANLRAKRDARKLANDDWNDALAEVNEDQEALNQSQLVSVAKEAVFNQADEVYDAAVDEAIAALSGTKVND